MLSPELRTAFNEQIDAELASAHLYVAMSAYCESINLSGFAHWFRVQADEERDHAMRFFTHVADRGGRVELGGIEAPPKEFGSPLQLFQRALDHERAVTARIDGLYRMATEQQDYASQAFLNWFVDEQVEEEREASRIVDTLTMVGDNPAALVMLDRELGARAAEG